MKTRIMPAVITGLGVQLTLILAVAITLVVWP